MGTETTVTVPVAAEDVEAVERLLEAHAATQDALEWEGAARIARAYRDRLRISRLAAEKAAAPAHTESVRADKVEAGDTVLFGFGSDELELHVVDVKRDDETVNLIAEVDGAETPLPFMFGRWEIVRRVAKLSVAS